MATVKAVRERLPEANGYRVTWELAAVGDEGSWEALSQFPNKTVEVEGGQILLVGRNRKDGAGSPLTDAHGDRIGRTGLTALRVNPWEIRPVAVGGAAVVTLLVW